jgi:hypothetical protein
VLIQSIVGNQALAAVVRLAIRTLIASIPGTPSQQPSSTVRRDLVDDSLAIIPSSSEQSHAMQSEQITEAGPGGIETGHDGPITGAQLLIISKDFKRLLFALIELHWILLFL